MHTRRLVVVYSPWNGMYAPRIVLAYDSLSR
jgi:hypothetical protein